MKKVHKETLLLDKNEEEKTPKKDQKYNKKKLLK